VFSGGWNEGFINQGVIGAFWSGSRNPANPNNAFNTNFDSFNINPNDNDNRNTGIPVR